MKKSAIKLLGGFDEKYKIVADFDLLQKAKINKLNFNLIHESISMFSVGGISQSTTKTEYEIYCININHYIVMSVA